MFAIKQGGKFYSWNRNSDNNYPSKRAFVGKYSSDVIATDTADESIELAKRLFGTEDIGIDDAKQLDIVSLYHVGGKPAYTTILHVQSPKDV
jgi:hypothetical protein